MAGYRCKEGYPVHYCIHLVAGCVRTTFGGCPVLYLIIVPACWLGMRGLHRMSRPYCTRLLAGCARTPLDVPFFIVPACWLGVQGLHRMSHYILYPHVGWVCGDFIGCPVICCTYPSYIASIGCMARYIFYPHVGWVCGDSIGCSLLYCAHLSYLMHKYTSLATVHQS